MKTTSKAGTLRTVAITAIITIAVIIGVLWALQNRFIYREVEQIAATPKEWNAVSFDVPGVGRGVAHHVAAQPGKPTLLFLQGYGLTGAVAGSKGFVASGMGVLAPEYPGHGGAEGSPSQATLNATAGAAMAWLRSRSVAPSDIVVYGIGIGAGPAIHAALQPNRRLVIVSGVADMSDTVRSHLPILPDFMVSDDWDNVEAIRGVKGRVTIVHGSADQEVPFEQGERLARASRTSVITLPGDHMIAFDTGLQSALAGSLSNQPGTAPAK